MFDRLLIFLLPLMCGKRIYTHANRLDLGQPQNNSAVCLDPTCLPLAPYMYLRAVKIKKYTFYFRFGIWSPGNI